MGMELLRVPKEWKHPTKDDFKQRDERWRIAYEPPSGFFGQRWRPINMDESWDEAMRSWWWERITYYAKRWLGYWPAVLGLAKEPNIAVMFPRDELDEKPPYFHDYRPRWRAKDRTHYQLYETVSEGTPISPPCASLEELADWCASQTARPVWNGTEKMDRAAWMRFFARGGWAPSAIVTPEHGFQSGVEAMSR